MKIDERVSAIVTIINANLESTARLNGGEAATQMLQSIKKELDGIDVNKWAKVLPPAAPHEPHAQESHAKKR